MCLTALILLSNACLKDNTIPREDKQEEGNKVSLLILDVETYLFKGGIELSFPEETNSFTISTFSGSSDSSSDFNWVDLRYSELDELLFSGTMLLTGPGQRTTPDRINPITDFETIQTVLPRPHDSVFVDIKINDSAYEMSQSNRDSIWQSIDQLKITKDYRSSNPDEKIHVFYYQSWLGFGHEADWDWYIILKN